MSSIVLLLTGDLVCKPYNHCKTRGVCWTDHLKCIVGVVRTLSDTVNKITHLSHSQPNKLSK